MRSFTTCCFLMLLCFCIHPAVAQEVAADRFLTQQWPAQWVTVPGIDREAYGVYVFRKQFDLVEVPDSFPVYVSADNQYTLYLNDRLLTRGPAKSDLDHWNYDRLDLAPHLTAGENTLAVRVWNAGDYRQEAQITYQTGLIVQGAAEATSVVNTDESWLCRQDSSYRPVPVSTFGPRPDMVGMYGYYVAGPGDRVDMSRRISDWASPSLDTTDWAHAEPISPGIPRNTVGMDARNPWRLQLSVVPPMGRTPERLVAVRRAEGMQVPEGFPTTAVPVTIPPRTTATLLLDQSYLTNAYPTLHLGGGAGAKVVLVYAEALYEEDLRTKPHRDAVAGKFMLGRQDSVFTDGSDDQLFTPLSYRTYRYLELRVTTADDPLVIKDLSAEAVGFPFERRATLDAPLPVMDTLLDVGWRTARLCAMDTYMDCPYWEQLQYIGDTRIQALVSLYTSGDERLVKNALNLMHQSRQVEGVTLSRYPTNIKQIIGPFSLWYIGMLRDYLMYGTDGDFVRDKLSGARQVLEYFAGFQDATGSLKDLPNWSFTDWLQEFPRGIPPVDAAGHSAVLDLQLLVAYQNARALEEELGMAAFADLYRENADQLANRIKTAYWNEERGLFADTGDHDRYSQHANSLAILAGIVPEEELAGVATRLLEDTDLAQASIYFKYYLHRALVRAGRGDDYLSWLGVWRDHLAAGLTTWAEDTEVATTRSDCHAWGSSPNIEFFRTVLGIDAATPHFRTVRIAPHLGDLTAISGEMPHPAGVIRVAYELENTLRAVIELPEGVSGVLVWRGEEYPLQGGTNRVNE